MTNGQLTKQILKAAKTQTGSQLLDTAKGLMRRFPMSSHFLLYDQDKPKVSEDAWGVLLLAAEETDKQKLDAKNYMLAGYGMKLETEYGRAKI